MCDSKVDPAESPNGDRPFTPQTAVCGDADSAECVRPGTLRSETPRLLMQLKQDRHTCTVGFSMHSVHSARQNVRAAQIAIPLVLGQILEESSDFPTVCMWDTWHSTDVGHMAQY